MTSTTPSNCTGEYPYISPNSDLVCITECPTHTYDLYGRCVLDNYWFDPNTLSTIKALYCQYDPNGLIYYSASGKSCLSECPADTNATTYGSGRTFCDCKAGTYLGLDGTTCVTACPPNSLQTSYLSCICQFGYYLSADKTQCVSTCPNGDFEGVCLAASGDTPARRILAPNQSANCTDPAYPYQAEQDARICLKECPAHTWDKFGVCASEFYTPDPNLPQVIPDPYCYLSTDTPLYSLDGKTCIKECPSGTQDDEGYCVCPEGKVIGFDGATCVDSCPANSVTSNVNGCTCATGYFLNADRTECVSTCPNEVFEGLCSSPDLSGADTVSKGQIFSMPIGSIGLALLAFGYWIFRKKSKGLKNQNIPNEYSVAKNQDTELSVTKDPEQPEAIEKGVVINS